MKKKSFGEVIREPQNIIALGVTLISTCALAVSIMQTQIMSEQRVLMYEQAKASVWPRLEIFMGKSHSAENYQITDLKLNVSNGGVGPAIITDMRVSYDDEPIKNWWYLFEKFNLPDSIPTYIGNLDINNSIIKIGANDVFLNFSHNISLAQYYFDNRKKIKVEIWYTSIYHDKWKVTYFEGTCLTEEVDVNFSLPSEEQFEN